MTDNLKAGDKCLECAEAGLDHKLRYFFINLNEQILKCEHRTCLWPHNDEVSSDEEEESIVNDEDDDDFLRNLLNFTMDNGETVDNKLDNVKRTTTNFIPMEEKQALNIKPEILKVTNLVPSAIERISDVKVTDEPAKEFDPNSYSRHQDLTGSGDKFAATQQCVAECYPPVAAVLPSVPDLIDLLFDYNPMVQLEPATAGTTATQSLEEPSKDETTTVATATTPPQLCDTPSKEETETSITATQLNEVLWPLQQRTQKSPQSKLSSTSTITITDFQSLPTIIDEPPKEGAGITTITQSYEVIPPKEQRTKETSEQKLSSTPINNILLNGLQPINERTGRTIMEQLTKKFPESEISKRPENTFDFSCLQPSIEVNMTIPQHMKQPPNRNICKKKIAAKLKSSRRLWSSFLESDDDDSSIPKAQISHYLDRIKNNEKLKKMKIARRGDGCSKSVIETPLSTSSEPLQKLMEIIENKKRNLK